MYNVSFGNPEATKSYLAGLQPKIRQQILKKAGTLRGFSPSMRGIKRLKGTDLYRLRSGDYRIFFNVKGQELTITNIEARRDAYR